MTMDQNSDMPRIGREPTPAERTMQHMREHPEVRDRAARNYWASQRGFSEIDAARLWGELSAEERELYERYMLAYLEAYHAMSPAERELRNRGLLKQLLDQNDAALTAAPPLPAGGVGTDETATA